MRAAIGYLMIVGLAAPAAAEPAGAQAEVLFRQGKALMDEGKFADACTAFDASYKLEPVVTTLINDAVCREKNVQYATAWGLFLRAARDTATKTDAASRQMNELATQRAAALEPRLSHLQINAKLDLPGIEITRNGERVEVAELDKALPIDGGVYTVSVRAPNRREWTTAITIKPEGDVQAINVPTLHEIRYEDRRQGSLVMPIVLGGLGLALGGGALAFHLNANDQYAKAELEPDNARQDDLWHSANTRRHIALGMAGAAVACLGVSAFLWVRNTKTEHVVIEPSMDDHAGGLSIAGTW